MCNLRIATALMLVIGVVLSAHAQGDSSFHVSPDALGQPLGKEKIAKLPKHVFADGQGLPPGQGTADVGQQIYAERCASCHGSQGQGGRALELVGDRNLLGTEFPDRGIAVYWPYAPSLFEYLYRSMPPENPASWNADELYSLLAHLLELNGLLEPDAVVNAQVLSAIVMPNVDGFRTVGR